MADRGMGAQSAMNRLKKAQSLGFGPLLERSQAAQKNHSMGGRPVREFRSRSRSSGRPRSSELVPAGNAAAHAVREQQERRREALRQVLKGGSDEPDLDGFLGQAKKVIEPKKTGPKLDVKVSKLDLKISTNTTARATAAASGARPKAGAKAIPPKTPESEELRKRQEEEKIQAEYEEMQRKAQPHRVANDEARMHDDYDDFFDEEEEESKRRKREMKKQRAEWRQKRREEKKKAGLDKKGNSSSESDAASEDEQTKLQKKEKEDSKIRAQTWRTINNNGRYSKVPGSYVGQLSDRELDKRIADAAAKNAGPLMSEAEVLAKINKGRDAPKRH